MADRKIRVLVVDDSRLVVNMLSDQINSNSDMEVVGQAGSGEEALRKVNQCSPDVVTLDLQMPGINGLDTLETLLAMRPIPVIIVSSLTKSDTSLALEALNRGAFDYVNKPSDENSHRDWYEVVARKVRAASRVDLTRILRIRRERDTLTQQRKVETLPAIPNRSVEYSDACIAMGISTGGPPALTAIFGHLQPPLPPMLIVQHMPREFTGQFADRLNSMSPLNVREAESGLSLEPNLVLVAPGGQHLSLLRRGKSIVTEVKDGERVSGHKPSIDVMMQSVARYYPQRCLGIIMTGMGRDGVAGCHAIRQAEGIVLGQDEATSDIYGMNRVAFEQGNVNEQFALRDLPAVLSKKCRSALRRRPALVSH